MLVQSKSKSKAYPILVQHLSNKMHCCPMIHQIKSRSLVHWTKSWQRLDNSVWTKIGLCLDSKYFHLMRNILWTKPGLTLDLDLFWTIFGLGQTLDCAWTANPIVIEHWITMDSGYMFHVGTRQKLTPPKDDKGGINKSLTMCIQQWGGTRCGGVFTLFTQFTAGRRCVHLSWTLRS